MTSVSLQGCLDQYKKNSKTRFLYFHISNLLVLLSSRYKVGKAKQTVKHKNSDHSVKNVTFACYFLGCSSNFLIMFGYDSKHAENTFLKHWKHLVYSFLSQSSNCGAVMSRQQGECSTWLSRTEINFSNSVHSSGYTKAITRKRFIWFQ